METLIGRVINYFTRLRVAVIALDNDLELGDTLLFLGHTTDFTQIACSMELEHKKIHTALLGMQIALKVDEAVRVGDKVYRVVAEQEEPQNRVLWDLFRGLEHELFHVYEFLLHDYIQDIGIQESTFALLLAGITLEPGTINPERLRIRSPYTSAVSYMTRLQDLAAKKLLVSPEPGEFRLSRKARSAMEKFLFQARQAMSQADPLPDQDSRRLADLLARLVQACMFSQQPPDTWSIRLSYTLMPDVDPPLPFVEQALSCLQAYRDDAHLAAWSPGGLDGPSIETLTIIWRGLVSSVDEVYDKLVWRGYELHDYRWAVEGLRQRGFIEGPDSRLQLSEAGRTFREQIECDTDLYFYKPFACLNLEEKTELSCLLSDLRNGLKSGQLEKTVV